MRRHLPFIIVIVLWLSTTSAVMAGLPWWPSIFLLALVLLGSWDLLQRKHSLYRNYPLTGHFRNIAEEMRTQIRQYFIESDAPTARRSTASSARWCISARRTWSTRCRSAPNAASPTSVTSGSITRSRRDRRASNRSALIGNAHCADRIHRRC